MRAAGHQAWFGRCARQARRLAAEGRLHGPKLFGSNPAWFYARMECPEGQCAAGMRMGTGDGPAAGHTDAASVLGSAASSLYRRSGQSGSVHLGVVGRYFDKPPHVRAPGWLLLALPCWPGEAPRFLASPYRARWFYGLGSIGHHSFAVTPTRAFAKRFAVAWVGACLACAFWGWRSPAPLALWSGVQ